MPRSSSRRAPAFACHRRYFDVRNASPYCSEVALEPHAIHHGREGHLHVEVVLIDRVLDPVRRPGRQVAFDDLAVETELRRRAERDADHLARPSAAHLVLERLPRERAHGRPGPEAGVQRRTGRASTTGAADEPCAAGHVRHILQRLRRRAMRCRSVTSCPPRDPLVASRAPHCFHSARPHSIARVTRSGRIALTLVAHPVRRRLQSRARRRRPNRSWRS